MEAILELEGVSKRYGEHLAVDGLSLAVPRGSVYGLLGPNGAGKTTTIRMVMRIVFPDEGAITLDGRPVDDERRREIGYLPEERGLYRKMKVLEHLVFLGTLRGLSAGEARRRAGEWLERFALAEWAKHKVEDLSKGMQQRVQVIGTILHRPQLLILDEPFAGLDPINTRELKDLLIEMAAGGTTVILSTHMLPQVDELCSHICLINRARAILEGPLEAIRERYGGNTWVARCALDAGELAALPEVEAARPFGDQVGDQALIELAPGMGPRDLLATLLERSEVEAFGRFVPDLENVFIRAVEEDREHAV